MENISESEYFVFDTEYNEKSGGIAVNWSPLPILKA
jgi:hypothetical protein